jgi:hypothetical protein
VRRAALVAAGLVIVSAFTWLCASCGQDVDLGGGGDGGTIEGGGGDATPGPDATPAAIDASEDGESEDCEPCLTSAGCAIGSACIPLDGGNTYCVETCEDAATCESDETCSSVTTTETKSAVGCTPKSGTCPIAPSPQTSDGSVAERCGNLVAPSIEAGCKDCRYDCQKNGCYAGWWCNVSSKECDRPPKTCN